MCPRTGGGNAFLFPVVKKEMVAWFCSKNLSHFFQDYISAGFCGPFRGIFGNFSTEKRPLTVNQKKFAVLCAGGI